MKGQLRSYSTIICLLMVLAFTLLSSASLLADDPFNTEDPKLDVMKTYNSDMSGDSVDLFRGILHIEHTDVSLPGRNGLDLRIVRWYDSKTTDGAGSSDGSCYNVDYDGLEIGEVLGYGWRMHMGRYTESLDRVPNPSEVSVNPSDILELPGGQQITLQANPDAALLPTWPAGISSSRYVRKIGPGFWIAYVPSYPLSSDPLYVYAPDGSYYIFKPIHRLNGSNSFIWNCSEIHRGDAAITISYVPFPTTPKYAYISSVLDSFNRQITFTYYSDPSDTGDLYVDVLTKITFPQPGGSATGNTVSYYYTVQGSSYPTASTATNPSFIPPSTSTTPSMITVANRGPFYQLGKIVAETGDATEFQYFRGSSNALANIRYPSWTVTGYDYAYIVKQDFGGGAGTSCYFVLSKRGIKGLLYAGRATSASTTRLWTYSYALETLDGTTPSPLNHQSVWTATVVTPESTTEKSYFNAFVPSSGVSCTTGDCPSNGNLQRWRAGLLLRQETYGCTSTTQACLLQRKNYVFDKVNFNGSYYSYLNLTTNFQEKGFSPIKTSETTTQYFSNGTTSLSKSIHWSGHDVFGNPTQTTETGYDGAVLRTTQTVLAWPTDSALKTLWLIHIPRESTLFDATGNILKRSWTGYYSDANHPGFPKATRDWVSDDGDGVGYWAGADWIYNTDVNNVDTVTNTLGHLDGVLVSGSPLNYTPSSVRVIVNASKGGTPLNRHLKTPDGLTDITVFTRGLDSNGLVPMTQTIDGVTGYGYDNSGRLSTVSPPSFVNSSGTTVTPRTVTYSYTPSTSHVPKWITFDENGAKTTTWQFDGFGNLARKSRIMDSSRWSYEDTEVDSFGRTVKTYVPYFSNTNATLGRAETSYDALNRPLSVTLKRTDNSVESSTTYSYAKDGTKLLVTVVSPASASSGTVTRQERYDSDGNLVQLNDATGAVHSYTYDALSQLTGINSTGRMRQFSSNNNGKMLWSKIPETENVATYFVYDHMGNLIRRTAPDATAIQYAYDFAGRQTTTTFLQDGSKVVKVYGGQTPPAGAPCVGAAVNPSLHLLLQANVGADGQTTDALCSSYDSLGRLYKKAAFLFGEEKDTTYDFNNLGAVAKIGYPSGRAVLSSGYNLAGLSTLLTDGDGLTVITDADYNSDFSLRSYKQPSGLTTQYQEDAFGRTSNIALSDATRTVFTDALGYYASGSLQSQNFSYGADYGPPLPLNHIYSYDSLHRLVNFSNTGVLSGQATYGYDAAGNMTSASSTGMPSYWNWSSSFGSDNHMQGWDYDDRGNLLGLPWNPPPPPMPAASSLSGQPPAINAAGLPPRNMYNQLNMITSLGEWSAIQYDAQGRRSWEIGLGAYPWKISAYYYDEAGGILSEMSAGGVGNTIPPPARDYVYLGNKLVAMWSVDTPICLTSTVSPSGSPVPGTITSNTDRSCFSTEENWPLQLTATPNFGFHFLNWTVNGSTVTDNPVSLTMDVNKNVVANFAHDIFCIAASVTPASTGTVSLSGATGSGPCYESFSQVTATATSGTGYHFDHWVLGTTTFTTNPLVFSLDTDNKALTAYFASNCPTVPTPASFGASDAHKNAGTGAYQILLSWSQLVCPYAVQYQVDYKESSSSTWLDGGTYDAQPNGANSWTLLWTAPKGCQSYDFQLRAYAPGTGTYGTWSATVTGITSTTTIATPPLNAKVWCAKVGLRYKDQLSWDMPADEACAHNNIGNGFVVYRSTDNGQTYTSYATVAGNGATSYTYTTLATCSSSPSAMYAVTSLISGGTPPESAKAYCSLGPIAPPLSLSPQALAIPAGSDQSGLVADFNGDGLPDLMLPTAFFEGNADGTFTDLSAQMKTTASAGDLIVGVDLNDDGLPDRVLADQKNLWVEFNAAGVVTLTPTDLFASGPAIRLDKPVRAIAAGQLPGSPGKSVVALTEDAAVILTLAPSGVWTVTAQLPLTVDGKALALADLNADGITDILVGGGFGAEILFWSRSTSDWQTELLPGTGAVFSVDAADANGDGYTDIALAEEPAQGELQSPMIYLFAPEPGASPGLFPMPHTWIPGQIEEGVGVPALKETHFANLMADPRPGIMAVSAANGRSVFLRNNGLGDLLATDFKLPSNVLSVQSADFNGDGWNDLAVFYRNTVRIYLSKNVAPRISTRSTLTARAVQIAPPGACAAQPPMQLVASSLKIGAETSSQRVQTLVVPVISPTDLIPGATLSQKMASLGFRETTWAGGKAYHLAAGVTRTQAAANGPMTISGTYLYPVTDVTGTPRVWVNTVGQIVSRIAVGPYGESLGLFSDPEYAPLGYAGYMNDYTGYSYTTNRYLDNQVGHFVSVDPSGNFNLHDPRTFNQYAYVAGNPLTYSDPQGLTMTITDEDPSEAFDLVQAGLQPSYRDYLSLSGNTVTTEAPEKLASEGDYGKALTMWISSQHTLSISTDFSWRSWFTSPFIMLKLMNAGGSCTENSDDYGNGDSHIYLNPSAFGPGVEIGGVKDMSAARAMTHEIGHSMYAIVPGLFSESLNEQFGTVATLPGYLGNFQKEGFPMAFETRIWERLGGKPRLTYNDQTTWDHGRKYVYDVPFF